MLSEIIRNTFNCIWYKFFPRVEVQVSNKKRRYEFGISPTQLKNYLCKDPILDWFKLYGESSGFIQDYSDHYTNFLLQRGNDFESFIISKFPKYIDIKQKYPEFCLEGVEETLQCMRDNVEIIYQGYLYDKDLQFYGIPDLIIRNDILQKMFNIYPQIDLISSKYSIVDIKFSTIYFGKTNKILNKGHTLAYKVQLYIYGRILDKTGYWGGNYFLMGRRLVMDGGILDGKVNLAHVEREDLEEKVQDALSWIRDVRREGESWDLENPHRKELCPNMKNKSDYPWHEAKKIIASKQKDLTRYWKISSKMRNQINDEYDSPEEYIETTIEQNHQKDIMIKMQIATEKNESITNVIDESKCETLFSNIMNFYVDFEFINGNDLTFDHITRTHLYMIGVGHRNDKNSWEYRVFMPKDLTEREEKTNIYNWLQYLKNVAKDREYQLVHWSHAEPVLFNKLKEMLKIRVQLKWVDLMVIVKEMKIVFKGMYNFSLKSVARSMKEAGLIETVWNDDIVDGLGANLVVIRGIRDGMELERMEGMEMVVRYNEVDCKVLYEIVNYLLVSILENKKMC